MNAIVLLSHVPDPRMIRRIKTLQKIFKQVFVIYWSRTHGNGFSYESSEHSVAIKSSDAPNLLYRFFENRFLLRKTIRTLLKRGIDYSLIYVSGVEILPAALKLSKICGAKIVLEIADIPGNTHFLNNKFLKRKFQEYLDSMTIRENLYYVMTSQGFFERYYSLKGIHRNQVFFFENGAPKHIFERMVVNPSNFLKDNGLKIGYFGAVRHFKSLKVLMDASRGISDISILIAGKGPDSEKVKRYASQFNNVTVIGKYNYDQDIVNLYSSVDIIYAVSNTDNLNEILLLPNKLYEAVVTGRPLIVASDTYLEEYVKKLGIGFSVEYGSVEDLKRLIEELKANKERLKVASETCLKIKERFFYEFFESEFINWMQSTILSSR